ncbi:MAG: cytidylate kinase-like family protein [Clostridia bacterium]|nr:cytidylate kinase-like family protein [Clostridia bacterium]
MANTKAITIARGYGSGGRTMGKMLAQELGWNYYDRELLRLASDESGISEELFAKADESVRRSLTTLFKVQSDCFDGGVIPPDRDDFISNENLFRYQARIIRRLAETENCVIVGRCANFVLKGQKNVVNCYVHAPEDVCIRTVMQMYGMSLEDAARKIRETDKRRGAYYRYFTGHDWQCADDYDLCLDSSRMGWEQCIRIVRAYLDAIDG